MLTQTGSISRQICMFTWELLVIFVLPGRGAGPIGALVAPAGDVTLGGAELVQQVGGGEEPVVCVHLAERQAAGGLPLQQLPDQVLYT